MERLVFIGPGRVGLALGDALFQADAVASLLYMGRRPDPPDHPLFHRGQADYLYGLERPDEGTTAVFLTVPDPVLPEIAGALAARGEAPPGCPAFHCAGALGTGPLAALHARGYRPGTLHPLMPILNPVVGAARLPGALYAISGERDALATARRLVGALGGRGVTVPMLRRPLYHAAAVTASNHLVVLLGEAVRMLRAAGASEEDAEHGILQMARGVLEDAGQAGILGALTGPVARGDAELVGLHLRTLAADDARLYAELGARALDRVRGMLGPEAASEMDELFRRYR